MTDTCVCCGAYVPEGFMICPGCEKFGPAIPNNKKDGILEYLRKYHCGKRNAVHSKELERIFKLDDRAVRRKISALRQEGYPICSGDMGYYYAESQKEINSTVHRLNDLAVFHRTNDVEDKWIAAPEGVDFADEEILQNIHFVEQFFEGYLCR